MSKLSPKLVGDFGEFVTALALEALYAESKLNVVPIGQANGPFDLIIPFSYEGTPFNKPAVIDCFLSDQLGAHDVI